MVVERVRTHAADNYIFQPNCVYPSLFLYRSYLVRNPQKAGSQVYEYKNHLLQFTVLIILFSTVNFFSHYELGINRNEILPYTVLMLGTYISS